VVTCHFCDGELDPDEGYRQIEGWERRRGRGGANQITLRSETGDYAHVACIQLELSRRRAGVTTGQEDLFR
jgi:hypothetical protein